MELRESEEIFIYPGVARARGGTSLCEMLMRDEMHNLHTFYLKLNPWMGARDVGHQSFLEVISTTPKATRPTSLAAANRQPDIAPALARRANRRIEVIIVTVVHRLST